MLKLNRVLSIWIETNMITIIKVQENKWPLRVYTAKSFLSNIWFLALDGNLSLGKKKKKVQLTEIENIKHFKNRKVVYCVHYYKDSCIHEFLLIEK